MRLINNILPAVVIGLGAAGVLLAGLGDSASAQPTAPADSVLATMTDPAVAQLGVPAFQGSLGAESAAGPVQTSTWSGSDPDGVLPHVQGWYGAPAGPGISTASVNDPVGTRDAETAWSGVGFRLLGGSGPDLISIGSLHTYARCTQPPLPVTATAYAATDSNTVYLFDNVTRPVAEGTNSYPVTGAQLGFSQVGTGTLTITESHVQSVVGTTASAAVRISVSADLADTNGNPLYSGPLMDLTIGSVEVDCTAGGGVTPPTTTTGETTTTTGETTTTTGETTTTTGETTTTTGGTTTAPGAPVTTTEASTTTESTTTTEPTTMESPTTTAAVPVVPGGPGGDEGPADRDWSGGPEGGELASTGSDVTVPAACGILLVVAGGLAVLVSPRRRRD